MWCMKFPGLNHLSDNDVHWSGNMPTQDHVAVRSSTSIHLTVSLQSLMNVLSRPHAQRRPTCSAILRIVRTSCALVAGVMFDCLTCCEFWFFNTGQTAVRDTIDSLSCCKDRFTDRWIKQRLDEFLVCLVHWSNTTSDSICWFSAVSRVWNHISDPERSAGNSYLMRVRPCRS